MEVTRRELLGMAAGAALLPARSVEANGRGGVSLFLRGGNCLTRESAAGYQRVLDDGCYLINVRAIIVPAGSRLSLPMAFALRRKAEAGHWVILESGLAFEDAREAESQCAAMREAFGLHVELGNKPAPGGESYLRYRWPADVLVRAFGRPAAVRGTACQPIAYLESLTVAAKKPIGFGGVIFLGSPLGPMLMAGDRDAALLGRRMLSGSV